MKIEELANIIVTAVPSNFILVTFDCDKIGNLYGQPYSRFASTLTNAINDYYMNRFKFYGVSGYDAQSDDNQHMFYDMRGLYTGNSKSTGLLVDGFNSLHKLPDDHPKQVLIIKRDSYVDFVGFFEGKESISIRRYNESHMGLDFVAHVVE